MRTKQKKNLRLINIRRWDSKPKNTHGWFVQVVRQGTRYAEFFSDKMHGGKKPSLQRAIEYRDAIKQSSEPKYKTWRQSIIRKNNTSGIPGVSRYVRMNKVGTIEQPY